MDAIDRHIINHLQGGFALTEFPFAAAAEALGLSEAMLIERIDRLLKDGVLTRFGPMFNADRLGGATALAAMAVPVADFERVAAIVNGFAEVAHNYAREHALNMWFVIATETPVRITEVINAIETETGLKVYSMPKIEEFFVEARFVA
ncbi:MAG: AsnC family transcriptional regulator [Defluviicoccus sp.]|nr:AsnC family transcriptional regulator [Defluviicoccus sp.]MDG4593525.1 AsnC family transcriptional regulator [Defluviicoccus sp.]MDS4012130.1 AsnC family transcriptional regulator [Defluviicoccus sp.]MDS4072424.1 AsnC family transcriptional regulator [Defluviicoccus sp.]